MNLLTKLLSFVWRGWFVFLAVIATLIVGSFFVYPFTFRAKDYPKAYFFLRIWAYIVFYGVGLWIVFPKKQPKQNGSAVIIANHTSMMDIMLMYILHPKPLVFVGKKELVNLPVFGSIYKRTNILVDRKDPNSRRRVLRASIDKLAQGYSVCLFPEGGVPEASIALDSFQDGAFVLATLAQKPMKVYTFLGLKERLPYAYFKGGPGRVCVALNEYILAHRFNKNQREEMKMHCWHLIHNQIKAFYSLKSS